MTDSTFSWFQNGSVISFSIPQLISMAWPEGNLTLQPGIASLPNCAFCTHNFARLRAINLRLEWTNTDCPIILKSSDLMLSFMPCSILWAKAPAFYRISWVRKTKTKVETRCSCKRDSELEQYLLIPKNMESSVWSKLHVLGNSEIN